MSKTDKKINKYRGYKFYKVDENDKVDIIRIVDIEEFNDKVLIKKEDGSKKSITIGALKDYTPLEPTGFVMFTRVLMGNDPMTAVDDIIVSLYRLLDVKLDMNEPYAICRQNITDFFYNLIATEEDHGQVGVSVSRDNCPTNIPYQTLAVCDSVINSVMVNFYIDDVIDDLLECIGKLELEKIDRLLTNNYIVHMKHENPMYISNLDDRLSDKGWCKTLGVLLTENNFLTDMDTMRNITALDFNLENYLNKEEDGVYSFNNIMLLFFNQTFKINAVKTMVIEYDYDINLGEFNNSHYVLLRDKENKLYVVVYTVNGEYLEKDLEEEYNKLGVSDRLRLAYFNKYSD